MRKRHACLPRFLALDLGHDLGGGSTRRTMSTFRKIVKTVLNNAASAQPGFIAAVIGAFFAACVPPP
jgi:hypothetical protein